MAYLAHISEDRRQQTILEHLAGTAELCAALLYHLARGNWGSLPDWLMISENIPTLSSAAFKGAFGQSMQLRELMSAGSRDRPPPRSVSRAITTDCRTAAAGGHPRSIYLLGRMCLAKKDMLEPYTTWKQEVSLPFAKTLTFSGKKRV